MVNTRTRGVYFVANDAMVDLVIAFLNSFRRYNPDISLCFIPYDDYTDDIRGLARIYRFSELADVEALARCDSISYPLYGVSAGQYRKLAAWQGRFDEFIYIDVDTIVLSNVNFAFEWLGEYQFITARSNVPEYVKWVWKESMWSAGVLSNEQIAYAACTSFIVSQRGALCLDKITRRMAEIKNVAPHMELFCAEQPLLNYLIVTSGKGYSSLQSIAAKSRRVDIPLEHSGERWCGVSRNGEIVMAANQTRPLMIHWAGVWREQRHKSSGIWNYYRSLGTAEMGSGNGDARLPE
jgi:hypothetical protein